MKDSLKKHKSICFAIGGTIEASIMPYHLLRLKASYPQLDLHCVVSRGALDFVTAISLQGLTGNPIYSEPMRFTADGTPAHIAFSDKHLTVLYPATARIVAEAALGIISCPVTRIFSFAKKSQVIVTPTIHPTMGIERYVHYFETLSGLGCTVVNPKHEPFWMRESSWVATKKEIDSKLGLEDDAHVPPFHALSNLRLSESS